MKKKIKKNEAFFDGLMESLDQAKSIAAGERVKGALIHDYVINPAPKYTAAKIRKIRSAIGFTQEMFARFCEVSLSAVRNWEQGVNSPPGPVLRILQALEEDPEAFLKTFAEIEVLSPAVVNE